MPDKKVTHIAPDISYLFPETASTTKVLCGRLASEVFANDEFVGTKDNLNPDCTVCPNCIAHIGEKACQLNT